MQRVLAKILAKTGLPGLVELLAKDLSNGELTSLLLEVYRRRTSSLRPHELLNQLPENRFIQPSDTDPISLRRAEANLRAAGIEPAQIDTIILTHAHPDHHEGLLTADKTARFANAELVIHEAEYAFWHDDGILSQAPAEAKPFFASARGALAPYAARTRKAKAGEVAPGLTLEHAPGHTPGHSILRLSSGNQQLLLVGDCIHNVVLQTAQPEITFVFDTDGKQAAASRRRVLDMAAADKLVISGAHMPFPGFSRISKDGNGYRAATAEWSYTL